MTTGYRHLEKTCREELPYHSIRHLGAAPKNSFIRIVDNFSILMESSDPSKTNIKFKDFRNYVLEHYKGRGFEKVESEVGDMRFIGEGTDLIVNMVPEDYLSRVTVFEYKNEEAIPLIERHRTQNAFKM